MPNNKQIAADVLEAVGGKSNVTFVTHCMTRLRFNLKDRSVPNTNEVKKISGVLGVQETGGQYQVIIGQNVPKVYDEICAQGGFAKQDAIDENLDGEKQPLTLKGIGNSILNYLSGSMTPLIPLLCAAGLFKTIGVLLGPDTMNLFSADSDIVFVCNMMYNAAFYFLPIYLGYTAAKKLGVTPILGLLLGGILIEPNFMARVAEGTPLTVYGIPAASATYSQTVVPIMLCIPVMRYIERFFKKVLPDSLSTIFAPFCTMVIMLPVALCAVAPIGFWCGELLGNALFALANSPFAWLAIVLIGASWQLLIVTGMHIVITTLAAAQYMQVGSDSVVLVATTITNLVGPGMCLGAWLRLRKREEKSLAFSSLVAAALGGVGEPYLYGICMRYKRPFLGLIVGGALAGLYGALTHVTFYTMSASNFLFILSFAGGGTGNMINAAIGSAIAFFGAAVVTYFCGFSKKQLENGPDA